MSNSNNSNNLDINDLNGELIFEKVQNTEPLTLSELQFLENCLKSIQPKTKKRSFLFRGFRKIYEKVKKIKNKKKKIYIIFGLVGGLVLVWYGGKYFLFLLKKLEKLEKLQFELDVEKVKNSDLLEKLLLDKLKTRRGSTLLRLMGTFSTFAVSYLYGYTSCVRGCWFFIC
jgi:hypothetical protein